MGILALLIGGSIALGAESGMRPPLPFRVIMLTANRTVSPENIGDGRNADWIRRISAANVGVGIAVKLEQKSKEPLWQWAVGDILVEWDESNNLVTFDGVYKETMATDAVHRFDELAWIVEAANPKPISYGGRACWIYNSTRSENGSSEQQWPRFAIIEKETKIPLAVLDHNICYLYEPLSPSDVRKMSMPPYVAQKLDEYKRYLARQKTIGVMPALK